MYQIKDAERVIQFEGTLLGESSSWRSGASRWVEFALYRTEAGKYVLSRVGKTLLYHDPACAVVGRNSLDVIPADVLNAGHVPCVECRPDLSRPDTVAPESPRYWSLVSETPEGIMDSLYRYDESGTRYLTAVARRLLTEAAQADRGIAQVYQIETIQ